MAALISVNLAVPRSTPEKPSGVTGIDKRPTGDAVLVRTPGSGESGLGSGLVGDQIFDRAHHGGDDQAVYAYAREDLDAWQVELGRALSNGVFGENLTTRGVDVTGALIGEHWHVGDEVVLEVSRPRIPCGTFTHWMGEPGWARRFTLRATPGAYLRVIAPGRIRAGDPVTVRCRPDHGVTIGLVFRAMTREPELLPRLSGIEALPEPIRRRAAERSGGQPAQ